MDILHSKIKRIETILGKEFSLEQKGEIINILKAKDAINIEQETTFLNEKFLINENILWTEKTNLVESEDVPEDSFSRKINKSVDGSVWEILTKIGKEYKKSQVYDKKHIFEHISSEKKCSLEEAKRYIMTTDEFNKKMADMTENGTYGDFYKKIDNNIGVFVHNNKVVSSSPYYLFWLADGSIAIIHNNGYQIRKGNTENYKCGVLLLNNPLNNNLNTKGD